MDTNTRYDIVVGGISWPGVHPGVAVVFGGVRQVRRYDLHFFDEVQDEDLRPFVEKLLDMQSKFLIVEWRCDTEDRVARSVVNELNEGKRMQLSLLRAPLLGDPQRIYSYSDKIRERLTNKSLFYRGAYDLPFIDKAELLEARPEDHPFLTALGSVVAVVDGKDPLADIKAEMDDDQDDYDILRDGIGRDYT